jgi:hypothetical protein
VRDKTLPPLILAAIYKLKARKAAQCCEVINMSKTNKPQFGALPTRYDFILNPYPDFRVSLCPFCKNKTGQRKIPLLIHIAPVHLIALKYTCRYCPSCDLLIANKHEVEEAMTAMYIKSAPDIIGNKYLIVGTVESTDMAQRAEKNNNCRGKAALFK